MCYDVCRVLYSGGWGGDILGREVCVSSRGCRVLQFVHGSFVQTMAHRVIAFLAARARNYRGFVTNSMFAVGAKTFPKCSSSFSQHQQDELAPKFPDSRGWYRPAGGQRAYGSIPSKPNHESRHRTKSEQPAAEAAAFPVPSRPCGGRIGPQHLLRCQDNKQ